MSANVAQQQEACTAFLVVNDLSATTLATLVIAFFSIAMFFLQYRQHWHSKKVTRANYQLALFEKRMEIYFSIEQFLQGFMREGQPTMEAALKLRYDARTAHFLFPERPLKYVGEIVEKSFAYRKQHLIWEPLRKRAFDGEKLTDEENRTKETALNEIHALEGWFHDQIKKERLQREFKPYLVLPDTV